MATDAPEPTEADLLLACDLAEEAGSPPEVVAALRDAAKLGMKAQRLLPVLYDAFSHDGPCSGLAPSSADLLGEGVPALIDAVGWLRQEIIRLRSPRSLHDIMVDADAAHHRRQAEQDRINEAAALPASDILMHRILDGLPKEVRDTIRDDVRDEIERSSVRSR